MPDWSDVVVRARGLSGRLLGRARLIEAARARDLSLLADVLVRGGYAEMGEEVRADPAALERHTRREAAERLAILARWSGTRVNLLAPLYDDQDRRNLRAIVRGVSAGVPIEQRLSGLVPTPSLPEPALTELARQGKVSQVAALLTEWGSPFGSALLTEAIRYQPDSFRLQLALDRTFASRALGVARSAGAPMLRYVRLQIDLENAWTTLALAGREVEQEPLTLFLDGGFALSRELFLECAREPTAEAAREKLVKRSAGTAVARVFGGGTRWTEEDRALAASVDELRREARLDPLSIGVVVQYVLRLRAEIRDLARIIWGIALEMPRALITDALVTS